MKKTSLILLSLFTFGFASSQNITPSATYEDAKTKKVRGLVNTYIAQNGESFSVGDTITLGSAFADGKTYSYIFQNAGIELYPLANTAVDEIVVIKKIKIQMRNALINTSKVENYVYGLRIALEDALKTKEIKSAIMSSDEALIELKRAKDKLDLGLITTEEFNAYREKLAPLID
tara:strand:+ start:77 stop:601 length:525 start_codon:yes stop_codon:yes gene_type:complete